jgi:hypothetical protein
VGASPVAPGVAVAVEVDEKCRWSYSEESDPANAAKQVPVKDRDGDLVTDSDKSKIVDSGSYFKNKLKKLKSFESLFHKRKGKSIITAADQVLPLKGKERALEVAIPTHKVNPIDSSEGMINSPTTSLWQERSTPSSPIGNWWNRVTSSSGSGYIEGDVKSTSPGFASRRDLLEVRRGGWNKSQSFISKPFKNYLLNSI